MKSWLQDNNIEMYSTHKERKAIVAEIFMRTLKNKIYKYIISILRKVFIDTVDDIVDEYKNTYQKTTSMKSIDVFSSIDMEFSVKNNEKDAKLNLMIMLQCQYIKILLKRIYYK